MRKRVEVIYAGEKVCVMERLRGTGNVRIDYRHVIFSLVRKPGAFRRYRYRESLFPSVVFRRAYDTLDEALGEKADAEYVRILHLAATTTESRVEEALALLLSRDELCGYTAVRDIARDHEPVVPSCQIRDVDLSTYDLCLQRGAA